MNGIKNESRRLKPAGSTSKRSYANWKLQSQVSRRFFIKIPEDVKTMLPLPPRSPIGAALNFGAEKYTSVPVPVLAIFACPHDWSRFFPNDPERRAARLATDTAACSARAESFAKAVPTARVVRIPNADHYVYRSNEAQVIDEMMKFLNTRP